MVRHVATLVVTGVLLARPLLAQAQLDIPPAAVDAEMIAIGGPCTEVKEVIDQAGRGPAVLVGYRIEVLRFLKGAACCGFGETTGMPYIYIPVVNPSDSHSAPALPKPAGEDDTFIYFLHLQRAGRNHHPRVTALSPERWFPPATPENVAAVEAAIPQPKEWGRANEGVQMALLPVKPVVKAGEPILIDLYFKNVSDKPILLPQQRLAAADYYPFLYFSGGTGIRLLPGGGTEDNPGRYLQLEKPVGAGEKSAFPPVPLEPGQSYTERIRLDSWSWMTSDGEPPFTPGTRWMLHAWVDLQTIPDSLRFAAGIWKGALESPFVAVTVE